MKRATLVLVAALAVPAAAAAQTTVNQTRPAAPDGSVSIEKPSGTVKVTGWARTEVQVKGTLGSGTQLELESGEKRTRVEVASSHVNPMAVSSEIEVMVPAASSVSVEGFRVVISVAGVTGSVKAETVNGSITHVGPSRDAQLQSVNGGVETTRPAGRTHAEAVNGAVTVRDGSGELSASTVNGTLLVSGGSYERARLETVAGNVRFDAALAPKATLGIETVSGTAELFFPSGFSGEFAVSSFSGAITNELGPAAQKKDEWMPAKELNFTSGSGGARVTVETLSGAIKIRRK
jgi:DUF4097 and DUF4098 domain-containing protein YvlB